MERNLTHVITIYNQFDPSGPLDLPCRRVAQVGRAIWKSGALPRWSGVLYVVTSFLVAFPLPIHIFRLIAGVLGVLVGIWIAASVQRHPETRTTAKPGEMMDARSRADVRETTGASNL